MRIVRLSSLGIVGFVFVLVFFQGLNSQGKIEAGDDALGTRRYDDFQTPQFCGTSCHTDFFEQWKQAMMSQAYTHHWDEIEYFRLAFGLVTTF